MIEKASYQEIRRKLMHYCAYQERYTTQVYEKMSAWQLGVLEKEMLMEELKQQGFVNDDRFLCSYIRGKFALKKWGRLKIKNELYKKEIPSAQIDMALEKCITKADYMQAVQYLINKKRQLLAHETCAHKRREKIIRHMLFKGYELSIIKMHLS